MNKIYFIKENISKTTVYLDWYIVNSPSDYPYNSTEQKWVPIVTSEEGYTLTENEPDAYGVKYQVEYPSPNYVLAGDKEVIIKIIGTDTTHFTYSIESTGINATEYEVSRRYMITSPEAEY